MDITKDDIYLDPGFPFEIFYASIPPSREDELKCHWHECLEISYVKGGEGVYYVNGQPFHMKKGDVILFNNMEPHAWRALPPGPMIQPAIVFSPSLIGTSFHTSFDSRPSELFWNQCTNFKNKLPSHHIYTQRIFQMLMEIEQEYRDKQPGFTLIIQSRLLEITAYLTRYFQDEEKKIELLKEKKEKLERLQKVILHLKTHHSRSICLEEAASIACMSPSYFSTFFKDTMGITFIEYLSRLRIEHAVELIASTQRTLVDIASECGFNSVSNFYRTYRLIRGHKPSQDRRR